MGDDRCRALVGGHPRAEDLGRRVAPVLDERRGRLPRQHRLDDVAHAREPVARGCPLHLTEPCLVHRARALVAAERQRDLRDARVAEVDQVPDHLGRPRPVVDRHQGRTLDVPALADHDGYPAPLQRVERRVARQHAPHQHGDVHGRALQERVHALRVGRSRPGHPAAADAGDEQDAETLLAEHLHEPVEHLDGDRVAERAPEVVADHHADDAGAARAQLAPERVRAGVAELGRGGEHLVPGLRRDRPGAGEGERRRRHRDARHLGHLGERGSAGVGAAHGAPFRPVGAPAYNRPRRLARNDLTGGPRRVNVWG